ncbi:MAG: OsmC family protein [Elusimicrobia bacterium]|nr:OsmC family protein [Elusimicrobiota bacterium]
MPHPFPHRYQVSLSWKEADLSEIASGARPPIGGGSPPEFDGSDPSRWSPEHLLLAALTQCLMLTFLALAKRKPGLELKGWDASGESVLEKTKEGLVFTSFKVSVRAKVPTGFEDEAKRLIESSKRYCIVANALKTPSTLEAEVSAA